MTEESSDKEGTLYGIIVVIIVIIAALYGAYSFYKYMNRSFQSHERRVEFLLSEVEKNYQIDEKNFEVAYQELLSLSEDAKEELRLKIKLLMEKEDYFETIKSDFPSAYQKEWTAYLKETDKKAYILLIRETGDKEALRLIERDRLVESGNIIGAINFTKEHGLPLLSDDIQKIEKGDHNLVWCLEAEPEYLYESWRYLFIYKHVERPKSLEFPDVDDRDVHVTFNDVKPCEYTVKGWFDMSVDGGELMRARYSFTAIYYPTAGKSRDTSRLIDIVIKPWADTSVYDYSSAFQGLTSMFGRK